MGKLQEFDITFTNNKVVYGPGESISGTVKIRTGNSLQFKGKLPFSVFFNTGTVSASVSVTAWFSEARTEASTYINFSSVMEDGEGGTEHRTYSRVLVYGQL